MRAQRAQNFSVLNGAGLFKTFDLRQRGNFEFQTPAERSERRKIGHSKRVRAIQHFFASGNSVKMIFGGRRVDLHALRTPSVAACEGHPSFIRESELNPSRVDRAPLAHEVVIDKHASMRVKSGAPPAAEHSSSFTRCQFNIHI